MMRQPDFHRFLTAVGGGIPDRVPQAEIHIDTEIKELVLGHPISTLQDEVDFWVEAGYDYVFVSTTGQLITDRTSEEPLSDRPSGSVHVHRWAISGCGQVPNWQGFESHSWIKEGEVDYSAVDGLRGLLPEGMLAVANQGPLYSGVCRLMGLESFSSALYEDPDLISAIYEKVGGLCVKIVEANAQKEWVGAIGLGDDIAYDKTLLTSPAVFRQYALPYYRRIGEICRRYRKPLIYHSDGNVLPVIDDLVQDVCISALHPIEPKAMDIRQLKRDYGSRVALMGKVEVDLLSRGTPDEVAAHLEELLRDAAPGGGYLLGSSNSITYYVPLGNYRAMLDTLEQFGSYPISL